MLGDPFELQFSIVKVDQVGSGEMIRVSMYPGKGEIRFNQEGPNMVILFDPWSFIDPTCAVNYSQDMMAHNAGVFFRLS